MRHGKEAMALAVSETMFVLALLGMRVLACCGSARFSKVLRVLGIWAKVLFDAGAHFVHFKIAYFCQVG